MQRADLHRVLPWVAIPLIVALGYMFVPRTSPLVGMDAFDFAEPIVAGDGGDAGDRISLSALRGRVVLLDFWAHWCQPCRRTVPILNALRERYGEHGLVIIGVNVESIGPRRLIAAHADIGAEFPTIQDRDGAISGAYGVQSLPTLVVVDAEGGIRDVSSGVPNESALDELVSELLEDVGSI